MEAAGFIVTVDGSEGHRSIAIMKDATVPEADLRGQLADINWKGPFDNNLEWNDATQSTDEENWTNSPGPTRQYPLV